MNTRHLFSMAIAGLSICYAAEDAQIRETKVSMPTYPFSDPNPVPNPTHLCYPYFTFEGYSDKAQQQEWKVVELENDYIKLSIFPEVGGKIWGAVEKSTGEEFIYHNHSVKFRQIAMRGPWTSGGIEFNFGIIGHAPTTSSPVDYKTVKNPDGSVSCFVGATDLMTGGYWCVEIRLEKDKAYFETRVQWDNNTSLQQPYYQWMNAGYAASDDQRYFFPGTHWIGHEGDVNPWPVQDGIEIDHYVNNNFGGPKTYHVLGQVADYYGTYYDQRNFGSVHASDFDEKMGMKVWIWGLSDQGMIWEPLLTDTDGQYVELQSGRVFNQPIKGSNYSPYRQPSFDPYDTNRWTEYWYPVIGTEGMVAANKYGALNLVRMENKVKLLFSPMQKIDEPIEVYFDKQLTYRGRISSEVLKLWTLEIPANTSPEKKISVKIGDNLLTYDEADPNNETSLPPELDPAEAEKTLYGKYMMARQNMNTRAYTEAIKLLEECLEKDAYFVPALIDLAELQYRQGHYEKSIATVTRARNFNAYDAGANYIFGLSSAALGKTGDAKIGFSIASQSPSFRTSAYTELAKEFVKESNWTQAAYYLTKALKANSKNTQALQILCRVYSKQGNRQAATELIDIMLKESPLNHIARFEQLSMAGYMDRDIKAFFEGIRSELPYETLLNLADWYESMGLYAEALMVLSMDLKYPLCVYRAAYLNQKTSNTELAQALLTRAKRLSPNLVMPHGLQTLEALRWAVKDAPGWPTAYYLGLAEWSAGNPDTAKELFESCGNEVKYAPFYLCRAQLKVGQAKLDDLLRSEARDASWRAGLRLAEHYYDEKMYAEAYACAKKYIEKYPNNTNIALKYAQCMVERGKYTEAVDYLDTLNVLPNEGSLMARIVFRDACLLEAVELIKKSEFEQALAWVERTKIWKPNLGVGKPYDADIDYRTEDFISAFCYEQMGDKAKADACYADVANKAQPLSPNALLKAYALKKLGKEQEAAAWVKDYLAKETPLGVYVEACFVGDTAKAQGILNTIPPIAIGDWVEKSERGSDLITLKAIVEIMSKSKK